MIDFSFGMHHPPLYKTFHIMDPPPSFAIHHENLIPFYLVEDKLKDNFSRIAAFIAHQTQQNTNSDSAVAALKD